MPVLLKPGETLIVRAVDAPLPAENRPMDKQMEAARVRAVDAAVRAANGNKRDAARALGISLASVYRILSKAKREAVAREDSLMIS